MKLRAFIATAAALVTGTALAILAPASPAVGFFSPPLLVDIRVESPATLVAKGAAVEVPVEVICAGANGASVSASLTQRAGSDIAVGYGSTQIGCTNQWQSVTVLMTAQPGNAFKKGPAVADFSIFSCTQDFLSCGSERDTQTISITK